MKADSQGVGLFLCLVEALDQTSYFLCSARATESTRYSSPLLSVSQPRSFVFFDRVVLEERPKRRWRAMVKENEHLAVSRSFETLRSKIEDCCDLLSRLLCWLLLRDFRRP